MDKLVKFMSAQFLMFFSLFNNIFMSICRKIRVGYQLSWEPLFLCHFLFLIINSEFCHRELISVDRDNA